MPPICSWFATDNPNGMRSADGRVTPTRRSSELGRRQAAVAAASIGAVDGIISSDLLRAAETAAIIAQQLGVGPVMVDQRLRERDVGEWTGLTRIEIDKRWPGWIDDLRRPDGFEDVDSVLLRVVEAFAVHTRGEPGRVAAGGHPWRRDPVARNIARTRRHSRCQPCRHHDAHH